jgi:hypothetical protein
MIMEYIASRLFTLREEVLTLYVIIMTPSARTSCANAGWVSVVLIPAA